MDTQSAPLGATNGAPSIPVLLTPYSQFVVWRLIHKPGKPKPDKIPFDPKTGKAASVNDQSTWSDYTTALNAFTVGGYQGIGFVFTANDPFAFGDLDDCGQLYNWNADARTFYTGLSQASWEPSQSGHGLHFIAMCDKAQLANKRNKFTTPNGTKCEFYTHSRFVAFSRNGWSGAMSGDSTAALAALIPDRTPGEPDAPDIDWQDTAAPGYSGATDDAALIERMLANPTSLAAASLTVSVKALWQADAAELGKFFPDDQGDQRRAFDHSSADMALMTALAWWTGRNPVRMARLFSQSALGQRDKWSKRPAYQERTVEKALSNPNKGYLGSDTERRRQQRADNERIGDELGFKLYTPIMSLDEMNAHLWFVRSGNGGGAVANANTKDCISLAIARNDYASSTTTIKYTDGRSGKEKEKSTPSIELWLKQQKLTADAITWKPNAQLICDVPERPGATGFNTWRGLILPKFADQMLANQQLREAWLPAWHHHLAYLIPNAAERTLFEQWLANIVQRPGMLPQTGWCFIATTTGIGRNWLGSVLVRVLRGHVLANAILDGVLGGNFNGRMSQKLLIIVDEARAGMRGTNAWQHAEKLKTLVNAELHEINEKHGLQRAEWNAMCWLVFSNHWDALPIERTDRRWNVVENPTHRHPVDYYNWLYGALQYEEFIASVWAHLSTLSLDGFNIGAGSLLNAARDRMLNSLASDVELALQEFKGAWPAPVARITDAEEYLRRKLNGTLPARTNLERNMAKVGIKVCLERMGKENTRFIITRDDVTEEIISRSPKQWLDCAVDAAARFLHRLL